MPNPGIRIESTKTHLHLLYKKPLVHGKDLRDCLASVMLVFWLCVFTMHCKYSISHLHIDVHLYKFFTCLDINKIRLKHSNLSFLAWLSLCTGPPSSSWGWVWSTSGHNMYNHLPVPQPYDQMLHREQTMWVHTGQCCWNSRRAHLSSYPFWWGRPEGQKGEGDHC